MPAGCTIDLTIDRPEKPQVGNRVLLYFSIFLPQVRTLVLLKKRRPGPALLRRRIYVGGTSVTSAIYAAPPRPRRGMYPTAVSFLIRGVPADGEISALDTEGAE